MKRAGDGAYQRPGAEMREPRNGAHRARARGRRVPPPRRSRPAARRRPHRRRTGAAAGDCARPRPAARGRRHDRRRRHDSRDRARRARRRGAGQEAEGLLRRMTRVPEQAARQRIVLAYSRRRRHSVAFPGWPNGTAPRSSRSRSTSARGASSRRSATARSRPAPCAPTCSTSREEFATRLHPAARCKAGALVRRRPRR